MHKLKRIAAVLLALGLLSGCAGVDSLNTDGGEEECIADMADNTGYVDSLTPGTDFYGFINGKELMSMSLDDKHISRGALSDVEELVNEQLDAIIDEIAASSEEFPKGSNEQMIHDLYHLICDDYEGRLDTDAEDTALIDSIMDRIESVRNVEELKQLWRDLTLDYGIYSFVICRSNMNNCNTEENIFSVGFLAPTDLESIFESDMGAVSSRDTMADGLKKAGIPTDEATKRATDIIYAMYDIAGNTDFALANGEKKETDSYNIYSSSELSEMLENLSIDDLIYISGYSGETPDKIVVYDPKQLKALDSLVDDEHVQVWKDIAVNSVLNTYNDWLPDKYNFAPHTSTGDRMAKSMIKSKMENILGEIYAERCYNEEKRETITKICEDLKAEYYILIEGADWLTADGRAFLKEKLDKMEFFIGADKPHEIDPADAELIQSSVLKMLVRYNSQKVKEMLDEHDKTPERNGFQTMAPCTVNACYSPTYNCINITAAITNYPAYDENADYYTNLGRIGSIVAHEISHAFDSKGVKFDAYGNLRPDAMPKEDIKAFEERQEKVTKYYNTFTVLGSHVNGKLTLAENFADISGVQCVLAIAKTPEEKKTVLENYAGLWMTLMQDTDAKAQLENDVHSPDIVRVNAVVACFDDFYDLYEVKEGDPMYVAPEERVRRW